MSISRRRFLTLSATVLGAASLPPITHAKELQKVTWNGVALGADAQMTLLHESEAKAQKALASCVNRIEELESLFSLYRRDSIICQLNTHHVIQNASKEFIDVIEASVDMGEKSEGLFDVTVQPLWSLYHHHYKNSEAASLLPSHASRVYALQHVDYRKIDITGSTIRIEPGMAITLNGIAQGYITDQIAGLLHDVGFENALINLGEYAAIGHNQEGNDWRVGIANPAQPWHVSKVCELAQGKAMASSGAYGARWNAHAHHLLSPKTGKPAHVDHDSVSVIAHTAMQADALSTIASLMPMDVGQQTIARLCPEAEIHYTHAV